MAGRPRIIVPGETVGEWTVLERNGRKATVQCSCGKIFVRYASNLTSGKSTRCQKCQGKHLSTTRTNNYSEEWRARIVNRCIRTGWAGQHREFHLDDEYVYQLSQQPCVYCGEPPANTWKGFIDIKYSGLDRVDSSKGYTADNVVPSCFVCNRAKSAMSQDDFRSWVVRVYETLCK